LSIEPFAPMGDGEGIVSAIAARESELAQERRLAGCKALTRQQVLARNWHSAPRRPSKSPRPLCHAAEPRSARKIQGRLSGVRMPVPRSFRAPPRRQSEHLIPGVVFSSRLPTGAVCTSRDRKFRRRVASPFSKVSCYRNAKYSRTRTGSRQSD
jgi:hypothetical protein